MASIDNVTDIEPRIQYVAQAGQTEFDYPFPIFDEDDLRVYVDGTLQAISTDYTVSGVGDDTGGTVTFTSALDGDEIVTIYRETEIARTTDIQQNGPIQSADWNDEQDKVFTILQELRAENRRALRLSQIADVESADLELSPLENWKGNFLRFDANGNPEPATGLDQSQTLSRSVIGQFLNPQEDNEAGASVTPSFFFYLATPKIDPRRYGAVAGGTASANTLAFARAKLVAAEKGGCIIIPESDDGFTLDDNWLIDSADIHIEGVGQASRIIFPAAKQLRITASRCSLQRLRVEGPDAGALSNRFSDSVIYIAGASSSAYISDIDLDDVKVLNSRALGVLSRFVRGFRYHGLRIADCGYGGVGIESCEDGVVYGCRIENINEAGDNGNAYGVYLSHGGGDESTNPVPKRIRVINNHVSDVALWTGIDTHGGRDLVISNNVIRNTVYGIVVGAGDGVGYDRAPKRVSISGNVMDGGGDYGAGYGLAIFGAFNAVGNPTDYAEDVTAVGNIISRYGTEHDNIAAVALSDTRDAIVAANVIREPRRHGIVLPSGNEGFLITGNQCIDPHGASGSPAFLRVVTDFQKGFVGGNSLLRGTLSAGAVAATFINRSAGTYTNSDIQWDYNYSQHTGGIYYSGPDTAKFESANTRRSDDRVITGSTTFDPTSLNDGFGTEASFTVTGAELGDFVEASFSNSLQGIILTGWVSAANTVVVRFHNETGGTINLAPGTIRVRVRKST